MREEKTSFRSEGLKLDASIYRADENAARDGLPLVVTCSGFQGLNAIHPARFARAFTRAGYTCFGFDYRGFAASEGEPGRVHVEEQVRDIVNALAFVRGALAPRNVVLSGWGMGGGLVLDAARVAEPLDGIIVMNGMYDAIRVQKALRGDAGWSTLHAWLDTERARLVAGGEPRKVDPFEIYPLDPETTVYVDSVLRKHDAFGHGVWPSFGDSLMQLAPEARLDHLATTPILVVHGDRNALHPPEEARSLFARYPGPKEAYWVPDAGHTEWMLDHDPKFVALTATMDRWMRDRR
jgi:pimeloyl-ACP methyl ester carboxylesterase